MYLESGSNPSHLLLLQVMRMLALILLLLDLSFGLLLFAQPTAQAEPTSIAWSSTGVFRDLVGLLSCLFITLALWGCTRSFLFALFKRLFPVRKNSWSLSFPVMLVLGFSILKERNCFSSFTHLFAKVPVNGPSAFPKMKPLLWKQGDSFSMVVRSFV